MTRDWYERATVRARGTPIPWQEEGCDFSPTLVPWALDPAIDGLAARELRRRRLCRYLHATAALEVQVVDDVAARIAFDQLPIRFGDAARRDALRVFTDEGFHAVQAADLLEQAGPFTPDAPPCWLTRLDALRAGRGTDDAALVTFLFTVATETLVSGHLRVLSRDPAVRPAVRAFVTGHAADEAWHGAYFGERFCELWGELAPGDRARLGPVVIEAVKAFLDPDVDAIVADLRAVGLGATEAAAVVARTVRAGDPERARWDEARPTLQCLRRAGALDEPSVRDALATGGLREVA
ncbi:MAG: diiron oxygenase [Alphaproteobacteria bacterium]|nr:diiron oxygenase [Alphaproteobacteria bacterium]